MTVISKSGINIEVGSVAKKTMPACSLTVITTKWFLSNFIANLSETPFPLSPKKQNNKTCDF